MSKNFIPEGYCVVSVAGVKRVAEPDTVEEVRMDGKKSKTAVVVVDATEAKSADKAKTQADVGSSNEDDDTPLDVPCTAVIKGEVPMFVEAPEVGDDDEWHGPPGSLPMVRTWSVDMSEEPVELEALDHDVRLVMRQHSQMSVFLYSIAIGDRNDGTTGNDGKAGDDDKTGDDDDDDEEYAQQFEAAYGATYVSTRGVAMAGRQDTVTGACAGGKGVCDGGTDACAGGVGAEEPGVYAGGVLPPIVRLQKHLLSVVDGLWENHLLCPEDGPAGGPANKTKIVCDN